ncbi:MAG: hypothetical protein IJT26_05065 [Bacteroidales bacterium]|nr:hypothetical protein [Bacteroidales bacterium]
MMKNKKTIILCLITFALIVCSCTKDDGVSRFSKDIAGQYMCESAVWMSDNDIDINGDSVSGKDLFAEFSGIDWAEEALNKSVIHVIPVRDFNVLSESSFVKIPLQGLKYDENSNTYSQFGVEFCAFGFAYSINPDGMVSFSVKDIISIDNIDTFLPKSEDIKINSIGNNYLYITVNTLFYDFRTAELVSGPVQYTFRRLYSDPYKCTLDTFIPYYSSNKSSL